MAEKKEFIVKGMTCASCVSAVEKAALKVEGVKNPVVSLATERLVFEVETPIDESELVERIKKAGYEIEKSKKLRKISLEIEGMTCASCVSAVEKAVNKLDGINSVSVNLTTEKAAIEYDPSLVRIADIKKAVEKNGYKAKSVTTKTYDRDSERREAVTRSYRRKFLFSSIFALPLLLVAMAHMFGISLPSIISPEQNPPDPKT